MTKLAMGIDHGNGYVKAISKHATILRPSEYALPGDVPQEVIAIGGGTGSPSLRTYKVGRTNESIVWGDEIHKVANPIATLATVDRYKQREYQILSEAILAALAPDGIVEVRIITGVPSNEIKTPLENDIIAVYKGAHYIDVEGGQKMLNVTDVQVLPQPLGSVLACYLDEDGYVADDSYEFGYIGVIDIGSGTTDIDGIKELLREPLDTDTFDLGINTVYQEIANWLNAKDAAIKASAPRVKKQLAGTNAIRYIVNNNYKVDITEIVDTAFRNLAGRVKTAINARWKDRAKFDKILLTGGGAAIPQIVEVLRGWHPDIVVVENAQEANAVGFYRYGLFLGRAESPVTAE
jgi:plasmid segregation protein ParM